MFLPAEFNITEEWVECMEAASIFKISRPY